MRNMSFMHTVDQVRYSSPENILKDVTRRLGWRNLKPGEKVMACEKCQGLKPGETIDRIREIEIISVTSEPLEMIIALPHRAWGSSSEMAREGFPHWTPAEFVDFFCLAMKCTPGTVVNRIEFRHLF